MAAAAACVKYIAGGNKSVTLKWKKDFLPEVCTSLVEVYDPATDSWSIGPELANALCGAGKCVILLSHISILLLNLFSVANL